MLIAQAGLRLYAVRGPAAALVDCLVTSTGMHWQCRSPDTYKPQHPCSSTSWHCSYGTDVQHGHLRGVGRPDLQQVQGHAEK